MFGERATTDNENCLRRQFGGFEVERLCHRKRRRCMVQRYNEDTRDFVINWIVSMSLQLNRLAEYFL